MRKLFATGRIKARGTIEITVLIPTAEEFMQRHKLGLARKTSHDDDDLRKIEIESREDEL